MRIFLTGSTGFVGSNLAHVFSERHSADVVAPAHEDVDLTDAATRSNTAPTEAA
jgi:dTDP-4-dehydrorhamnose reductase